MPNRDTLVFFVVVAFCITAILFGMYRLAISVADFADYALLAPTIMIGLTCCGLIAAAYSLAVIRRVATQRE